MKRPRRNHSATFKAKVALAALQGDATLAELSQCFDVHGPTRSQKWKQQLLANAVVVFGEREGRQQEGEVERLHGKHGELTMERDLLRACGGKTARADRQALIDREAQMPITKQCQLLRLSRSSVYYQPVPVAEEDLAIMRRLDELHLCYPFFGARKLTVMLNREGIAVGRKRVRRLMRLMGIFALYRRPRTTVPVEGHRVFPYLLSGVEIVRPNQVWEADITYLPMRRGFLYLVAIVDVFSRRAMAWRLSNTLTVDFCVAALEEALGRYGSPEIFNTEKARHLTSQAFIGALEQAKVRISMDGRGGFVDNVFIERLWRSVKYEEVYLHAWETGAEAKAALARYFAFYNGTRPHEALAYRTPDELYFGASAAEEVA